MDFALSAEQEAIGDAVARICARFGDDYWLAKDRDGGFPGDFHRAFADAGWLGVCIPQQYGGSGLGVTEAALMMQTIAESGAGLSGASALHMNIFGLNPVVVFGSEEQKQRMLPPLVAGRDKACFTACETALMSHGGMGYAKEFHVERYLRESLIVRVAPITPHMILSFIAEKALGLPKSY